MDAFDPPARTFVRGDGCFLFDARGGRVFDAVSSIWTTVHGHCRPEIVEAIVRQARVLDHATLLGAANEPAEALAERLARLLGLRSVLFASDGASAIEAALKIALQYWQNGGEPQRTRFLHLADAYHGDTAGAMSVSDIGLFKRRFESITFETRTYDDGSLRLDEPDLAAVIVEPIVQAAAGMRLVDPRRYEPLRGSRTLLIVDEIATGFGRTGRMFAHQALDLRPDIVCVGKGLSGGTLPLSATIASERIFEAFGGREADRRHFFHGHSYAGNPIACAAALANLDIFETCGTLAQVTELAGSLERMLAPFRKHDRVSEVRQAGLMVGIDLREEAFDRTAASGAGRRVADALYDAGHFTRPIGNTIQLVPPLTSAPPDLESFAGALEAALR